jgi:hypothetical protein
MDADRACKPAQTIAGVEINVVLVDIASVSPSRSVEMIAEQEVIKLDKLRNRFALRLAHVPHPWSQELGVDAAKAKLAMHVLVVLRFDD